MSNKILVDLENISLGETIKWNGTLIKSDKKWGHLNLWFELLSDNSAFVYHPSDIPDDLRKTLEYAERDINGNKIIDKDEQ